MLGDAIAFPKAREGWLRTIAVGGLLFVTSVFVLPLLFLLGYSVRVIRTGVAGETTPPTFEKWGDLLVSGLKLFTIQLIYAIVALFSLTLSALCLALLRPELAQAAQTDAQTPEAVSNMQFSAPELTVVLFAYLLLFLIAYVSLAATARFAEEDRFKAAFEFRTVVRTALTSEFFVGFVLFLAVGLVLGTVGIMLSWMIVGLFLMFYTYVVASYLIGRGYGNANKTYNPQTARSGT